LEKLDLKRALKELYNPPVGKIVSVVVPEMPFLMVDGVGDPNTSEDYMQAIGALYSVGYTLKFISKPARDFVVMPLETLWWNTGGGALDLTAKSTWQWTAMLVQPAHVTGEMVAEAMEEAARKARKKRQELPALAKLRLERFDEGLSAQVMYIGPWDAEGPTIERMHQFIHESGYRPRGHHHEVYLSDPRAVSPERLKTIIRQPMG